MGRRPCCSKEETNKGAWTAIEDKILIAYIKANGEGQWTSVPKRAGLKRCGKSCRLRWLNYLRPNIKRGNISPDEEDLIIRLHNLLGNRWSLIAGRLPGRTDNEIKNYWNTTLAKKATSLFQPSTEPTHSQVIRTPANAMRCNKIINIPFENQINPELSSSSSPIQDSDFFNLDVDYHQHDNYMTGDWITSPLFDFDSLSSLLDSHHWP